MSSKYFQESSDWIKIKLSLTILFDKYSIKKPPSVLFDTANSFDEVLVALEGRIVLFALPFVKNYLSEPDYNKWLCEGWLHVDDPHKHNIKDLKSLFNISKPELLMDKSDYKKYLNLPHKIIVYRGIASSKQKKKALSWTLSFKKAKWFAERWKDQPQFKRCKPRIYKAEINKADVNMYTNERDEQEIVLNPSKLIGCQNI